MRGLVAAVAVMGVVIVAGVATLGVLIGRRTAVPPPPAREAVLADPAGTRIAGVSAAGDRLAVWLAGGGPDRVVVVDMRSGQVQGRIGLAQ